LADISFRNVVKTYDNGVTVVPGLDLEIRDREFVVLVGPSGCGKSTTLRMIAGLEEVTSGDLLIGGRRVNDVPPKDRDIAMVFQSYALYPHMTVYKNMAFGLLLRKVPKDEIDRKVREAAHILGLEPYLDRRPRALSGGQRQRVALGRAMVRDPAVFLLDEPLSNLDAKLRTEMRGQIIRLHQRLQTTFVYVTHDQTEAMTMGDRICVLKDGVIQQFDTPQTLYQTPRNLFVAGFIGSPQMNFIDAVLGKEDGEYFLSFGACRVRVPAGTAPGEELEARVGKELVLGIRPEDIHGEESFLHTAPDGRFTAHVELAELMGSEIYLYLKAEGRSLTARVPSRIRTAAGEEISLALDSNRMHLFDKETQLRLGS
jgi:multiple sugar transport system ATP-binding protein